MKKQKKSHRSCSHLCFEKQYVKCSFKIFASSSACSVVLTEHKQAVNWLHGYWASAYIYSIPPWVGLASLSVRGRIVTQMRMWSRHNHKNIVKAGQCFFWGCSIWRHEYVTEYTWKVVFSKSMSWDKCIGNGVCCWHLLAVNNNLIRSSMLLDISEQVIPACQEVIHFLKLLFYWDTCVHISLCLKQLSKGWKN